MWMETYIPRDFSSCVWNIFLRNIQVLFEPVCFFISGILQPLPYLFLQRHPVCYQCGKIFGGTLWMLFPSPGGNPMLLPLIPWRPHRIHEDIDDVIRAQRRDKYRTHFNILRHEFQVLRRLISELDEVEVEISFRSYPKLSVQKDSICWNRFSSRIQCALATHLISAQTHSLLFAGVFSV